MADILRGVIFFSELAAIGLLTHGLATKRIPWRYAFGFYLVLISALAFTIVTIVRPPGLSVEVPNFWSNVVRLQFIWLTFAGLYMMFRRED